VNRDLGFLDIVISRLDNLIASPHAALSRGQVAANGFVDFAVPADRRRRSLELAGKGIASARRLEVLLSEIYRAWGF
jgi:hypothetical protein